MLLGTVIFILCLSTPSAANQETTPEVDCKYECSQPGYKPTPRPGHTKTSNGCGTAEFPVDVTMLPLPEFEICCNHHDICYDTCGADRMKCDKEFLRCMMDLCRNKYAPGKDDVSRNECKMTAKLFHNLALGAGCAAYLRSQESACHCVEQKEL